MTSDDTIRVYWGPVQDPDKLALGDLEGMTDVTDMFVPGSISVDWGPDVVPDESVGAEPIRWVTTQPIRLVVDRNHFDSAILVKLAHLPGGRLRIRDWRRIRHHIRTAYTRTRRARRRHA